MTSTPKKIREQAALEGLRRAYQNWEREQAEAIDVLEAVGKYLETLK